MVEIYCDSGSIGDIKKYAKHPRVSGFTTNPSLAHRAGIRNFRDFGPQAIDAAGIRPISLEVLAPDHQTMASQAREIASWGENVYVKIPITDAQGASSRDLIHELRDLNLNITAIMTHTQMEDIQPVLQPHHIVSIFNGRITDTRREPMDVRYYAGKFRRLWASTRDVGSLRLAAQLGYDIITMSPELIEKLPLEGRNLTQYSLDTVRQFVKDGEGISW